MYDFLMKKQTQKMASKEEKTLSTKEKNRNHVLTKCSTPTCAPKAPNL